MILAGDIGGTNTRLAFFDETSSGLKPLTTEIFPSGEHAGLEEIAVAFVGKHGHSIRNACFGIAGPVRNGICETPNLPWVINAVHVSDRLGGKSVRLLNDLEANAYGIAELDHADFAVLSEGTAGQQGNCALISAGTGLGEAGLLLDGSKHRPFPSEGGHADFAPTNELEIELLRYLLQRYEHVSYERVLSGPGLQNIYYFLRDTGRAAEPPWLKEQLEHSDVSAVISKTGLNGSAEICVQALNIFCSIYGAEAGNLALKMMATGGLYIGGGIAPKILSKLRESNFMNAFGGKGRIGALLRSIPIKVIMNDKTALLGAARVGVSGSE
jgi:glucokinase